MRSLCVGLVLVTTVASAQQQLSDQSLWERCYGTFQPRVDHTFVHLDGYSSGVYPSGGSSSGSGSGSSVGSSSGGGAGGSPEGLLIAAVILAAALPVVVYVIDSEAPPIVLRRFHCPTFAFEAWGGVEGSSRSSTWAGVTTGRLRTGYSHFGTDFQFDASPFGVGSYSFHLLVRPTPKEHIEGGFAFGYKRSYFGLTLREGFELALPHQYVLWREEGRQLGIELRPGVFFTRSGLDVSVDLAVLIPLLDILSVRIGTRAFSYDGQTLLGFSAGLSLHL